SDARFQALARGPDFWVVASAFGTFYRRADNADAWEKIPAGPIEQGDWWGGRAYDRGWDSFGKALGSVTIDPVNPRRWWFTDWYAIYESLDAGQSWTLRIDGIEATVLHTVVQDPNDPGFALIGMADCGAFYSNDGGRSFSKPNTHLSNIKSIAFSSKEPSRLYATGNHEGLWQADHLFISMDRGHSWNPSPHVGLPGQRRMNTVTVHPENPYQLFVGMAGSIAPGEGGVYRSDDGGRQWVWMGEGLPEGKPWFQGDIWSIGTDLVAGVQGDLVALSRGERMVASYDPSTARWTANPAPDGGVPHSLAADHSRPGRFYLGSTTGVYLSENSGRDWRRLYDGQALHVTVDRANPQRLAAGAAQGPIISSDSGETWEPLDTALPFKVDVIPAFVGDRLLVGTGGNGVFWMPLSPGAAEPVTAKKLPPATVPGPEMALPVIGNLHLEQTAQEPGTPPPSWGLWTGEGAPQLQVLPPSADDNTDSNFLRLSSKDGQPTYGTAYNVFKPTRDPFVITGRVRTAPGNTETLFAVESFDEQGRQIQWQTLAQPNPGAAWLAFTQEVVLPPGTARAQLVLSYRGSGAADVTSLSIAPPARLFLEPTHP
ncbi:MAG: hypothetical protein SNJ84_08330, partial [Verrucomicrobiia bacterium]